MKTLSDKYKLIKEGKMSRKDFLREAKRTHPKLISNTTRTYVFRNHLKDKLVKEFSLGALIGAALSGLIIFLLIQFYNVNSASEIKVDFLKPIIGIFIIWYLFLKGSKKEKISKSFIK